MARSSRFASIRRPRPSPIGTRLAGPAAAAAAAAAGQRHVSQFPSPALSLPLSPSASHRAATPSAAACAYPHAAPARSPPVGPYPASPAGSAAGPACACCPPAAAAVRSTSAGASTRRKRGLPTRAVPRGPSDTEPGLVLQLGFGPFEDSRILRSVAFAPVKLQRVQLDSAAELANLGASVASASPLSASSASGPAAAVAAALDSDSGRSGDDARPARMRSARRRS